MPALASRRSVERRKIQWPPPSVSRDRDVATIFAPPAGIRDRRDALAHCRGRVPVGTAREHFGDRSTHCESAVTRTDELATSMAGAELRARRPPLGGLVLRGRAAGAERQRRLRGAQPAVQRGLRESGRRCRPLRELRRGVRRRPDLPSRKLRAELRRPPARLRRWAVRRSGQQCAALRRLQPGVCCRPDLSEQHLRDRRLSDGTDAVQRGMCRHARSRRELRNMRESVSGESNLSGGRVHLVGRDRRKRRG